MRLMGRFLLRLAVVAAALLLLALVFVLVVAHTDRFREWMHDRIVSGTAPLFPAKLAIGRIESSIFGTLVAHDVAVVYQDNPIIRVGRMTVEWTLRPLLVGAPPRIAVVIDRPEIRLLQSAAGEWNIVAAFETEPTELPSWFAIDIDPVTVREGTASVARAGEDLVQLGELNVDARLALRAAGIEVAVPGLAAALKAASLPAMFVRAQLVYDNRAAPETLVIHSLSAESAQSRVTVVGDVQDLDAPVLHLDVTLDAAAAELRQIVPAVPLRSGVTGTLALNGPLGALQATARVAAGEALLQAAAQVDLTAADLEYRAQAILSNMEPAKLLDAAVPGGVIGARVEASGGVKLASIDAQAEIDVRGVRWREHPLGDVTVSANLAAGSVIATADARGGPARLSAHGRAALAGEPAYQLTAQVRELDPARIPGGWPQSRGTVNVDVTIDATGNSLDTLQAQAQIDLLPSSVGSIQLENGRVRAALAQQRVRIDELRLSAPGTTLSVSGNVGIRADADGDVSYNLQVADIEPWLRLAGQSGKGALSITGKTKGRVDALQTSGQLEVKSLTFAEASLERGDLRFDLAGAGTVAPRGTVSVLLHRLRAGVEVESVEANAVLVAGPPAAATVQINARDSAGRPQRIAGQVVYGGRERSLRLDAISLDTPAGVWQLARPAEIVQSAAGVRVGELRLEHDRQYVSVRGQVAPELALEVRAVALDLALLNVAHNRFTTEVAGRVDAALSLRGRPERPQPDGTLQLRGGAVRLRPLGVEVHDALVDVELNETGVQIIRLSAQAGDGRLSGSGRIGLQGATPGEMQWSLEVGNWPAIDTARHRATIAASLQGEGTLRAPVVRGRVDVLRASLRPDLRFLEQQSLTRDPTIIVVGRESSSEREGTAETASGEEASDIWKALALEVTVRVTRNSWIRHPDASIELTGEVNAAKRAGGELMLVGGIQTVRGWVSFRNRRFTLREGGVRFTGNVPIDPSLDVVAGHRFPDYDVEIVIGGTVEHPSLTLRSTPSLEQSDILALILFGKPVDQLAHGERVGLQDQALSIVGTYAAQEIGRSISDALGLDHLGIDIRQVDFEGGTVGVGTYLTERTYVTIDQDVTKGAGTKATIEFSLTPSWQILTSTNSVGDSEAGLIWRKRY
jgi:autotransporter translocation and assembly factor TamB